MWAYVLLVAATVALEFAYIGWVKSAVGGSAIRTAMYGTAVAGLALAGLKGALELPFGWLVYLLAVFAGCYAASCAKL